MKHIRIYEEFGEVSISEIDGIETLSDLSRFLLNHSGNEKEAEKALKLIQSPKLNNLIGLPEFPEYMSPVLNNLSRNPRLKPLVDSLLKQKFSSDMDREKEVDFKPVEMIYHKDSDDMKS